MPDPTPEEIAGKLTKAQERAVFLLPAGEFKMYPVSISRVIVSRLLEKGILVRRAPKTGFGLMTYDWSPIGLALRAYLNGLDATRSQCRIRSCQRHGECMYTPCRAHLNGEGVAG